MNTENSPQKMRMKKGIYILPNLFTSASLFCGFYSIIASFKEYYLSAAVAVLIAVVFDGLDGRIARLTNTTSKFGAEYDSLADVISFGIAPALLAYSWSLSLYGEEGWLAAFLFVLCGALRLARYNIQIGVIESNVFNGLPIPAAASVVATTVIFFDYAGVEEKFGNPFILVFVIILALLMVSSIKYYSFKDMKLLARKPFMTFFLIILLIIIVYYKTQIMFFVIMLGYALSGPIWWVVKFIQKSKEKKINIH